MGEALAGDMKGVRHSERSLSSWGLQCVYTTYCESTRGVTAPAAAVAMLKKFDDPRRQMHV